MCNISFFLIDLTLLVFALIFKFLGIPHVTTLDRLILFALITIAIVSLMIQCTLIVPDVTLILVDIALVAANLSVILLDLISWVDRLGQNGNGHSSEQRSNEQIGFHV